MTARSTSPWRTTPLRVRIVFLLAVFFTFASFGFAGDIMDMGRQPVLRLAASVAFSGLFPVCYAATGVILRGKFWKAAIPLFIVQFLVMGALGHWVIEIPPLDQLNVMETARLQNRLVFDGCDIMASGLLGYLGFLFVSISESRRYIRTQTEKVALENEMAAAREVQRVMVPEDLPPIAGYELESIYSPASEVGGDFFQVIPLKSERTLVVIGDVSGKGLRAAMIVSMIVGMLRTASGFTEEPAEILAELNRRLCGHMHDGFASCIAARLEATGRITLANAGHPAPYINGMETPFAGSLPLGLVESASYEQMDLEMRAGDVFVLMTDGVAEAQDERRVLFGFRRVESLLREGASAKVVAEAAQHHGQNDDLTVISIAREA